MLSPEGYQSPDELIEPHPLDEIGMDINVLLEQGGYINPTMTGFSTTRNIQHGDVSFFLCRIDSPESRKFTVGIDLVHDDELVAVCSYQWDIYDPASSSLNERDFKKLRTVLNVAGMIVRNDAEA